MKLFANGACSCQSHTELCNFSGGNYFDEDTQAHNNKLCMLIQSVSLREYSYLPVRNKDGLRDHVQTANNA